MLYFSCIPPHYRPSTQEPWQRQLVRYAVACVPAFTSWSQFRQTLEGLCVPCGEETFPLEKDAPPAKPLSEKKED